MWSYAASLPLQNLDSAILEEIDDGDESDPLFIPLPFTEKKIQPLPYAGAGEEWQTFLKIAKDEKWRQRVKDDLKHLILTAAKTTPFLMKWAGGQLDLGPSWLIVTYPSAPPPEYVRWGYVVQALI